MEITTTRCLSTISRKSSLGLEVGDVYERFKRVFVPVPTFHCPWHRYDYFLTINYEGAGRVRVKRTEKKNLEYEIGGTGGADGWYIGIINQEILLRMLVLAWNFRPDMKFITIVPLGQKEIKTEEDEEGGVKKKKRKDQTEWT